jgi:hypothetical protein
MVISVPVRKRIVALLHRPTFERLRILPVNGLLAKALWGVAAGV